jgi:hypothetical protein
MSWELFIYTTRSPSEVSSVADELRAALATWWEERADELDDDEWAADEGPDGERAPTRDELLASHAHYQTPPPPEPVLERLAQCRGTYWFRKPPDATASPLHCSVLRFLLERLAPCLIGDKESVELGEVELSRLSRLPSRGKLGREPAPRARAHPIERRREKSGEVRALRILARVDAARADPNEAIDLRALLAKLSAHANAYVALLADEGALSDAAAKKKLGLDSQAFAEAVSEVARSLDIA